MLKRVLWSSALALAATFATNATASSSSKNLSVDDTEWLVPVKENMKLDQEGNFAIRDLLDIGFDDEGDVDTFYLGFDQDFWDEYSQSRKGSISIDTSDDEDTYFEFIGNVIDEFFDHSASIDLDYDSLEITNIDISASASSDKHDNETLKYTAKIEFRIDASVKGKHKTLKGQFEVDGTGVPGSLEDEDFE